MATSPKEELGGKIVPPPLRGAYRAKVKNEVAGSATPPPDSQSNEQLARLDGGARLAAIGDDPAALQTSRALVRAQRLRLGARAPRFQARSAAFPQHVVHAIECTPEIMACDTAGVAW